MDASEVLQRFAELPFPVEAELGNLTLTIGEVLALQQGTILRTDHPAGAPFTVRAGGAGIASAEAVVMEGALAVRVKSLWQNADGSTETNGTD